MLLEEGVIKLSDDEIAEYSSLLSQEGLGVVTHQCSTQGAEEGNTCSGLQSGTGEGLDLPARVLADFNVDTGEEGCQATGHATCRSWVARFVAWCPVRFDRTTRKVLHIHSSSCAFVFPALGRSQAKVV